MLTRILTTHKQMLNIQTQVPWAVQTHPALKFSLALDACPPTRQPGALRALSVIYCSGLTRARPVFSTDSVSEWTGQAPFCWNSASRSHLLALLCPHLISSPFRTPSLVLTCGLFYSRTSALSTPFVHSYILFTHSGHSIFFLYNIYSLPLLESWTTCFPHCPSFLNQWCNSLAARNSLKSLLAALVEKKMPGVQEMWPHLQERPKDERMRHAQNRVPGW